MPKPPMRPLPPRIPYQVKHENDFWVVNEYGVDGKKALAAGKYLLQHSILPTTKIVLPEQVTEYDWINLKIAYEESEIYKWFQADFAKAEAVAEALKGPKLQVGHVFSVPVADGGAWYLVTKVLRSACSIEWRGWFNEDRYTDHHFGFGGKFGVAEIERYVKPGRTTKLFGKK